MPIMLVIAGEEYVTKDKNRAHYSTFLNLAW